MIITRTPFRITLGGGGTDLPSFYEQEGGFVFSMCINKYMYIILKHRPVYDRKLYIRYSQVETADTVDEIKHPLARDRCSYLGQGDMARYVHYAQPFCGQHSCHSLFPYQVCQQLCVPYKGYTRGLECRLVDRSCSNCVCLTGLGQFDGLFYVRDRRSASIC